MYCQTFFRIMTEAFTNKDALTAKTAEDVLNLFRTKFPQYQLQNVVHSSLNDALKKLKKRHGDLLKSSKRDNGQSLQLFLDTPFAHVQSRMMPLPQSLQPPKPTTTELSLDVC